MTGNLAVADWDGDGLADLLLGQWHERESPHLLVPQRRATRAAAVRGGSDVRAGDRGAPLQQRLLRD